MQKNKVLLALLILVLNFTVVLGKTISSEELKSNLDKYTIIDVRGEKSYLQGHIPGSTFTSWTALSNMSGKNGDKGWGVVTLDAHSLTEKLQNLGIMKNKPVVVYGDAKGWGEDTRIWWTLKLAEVPEVYVLSGGINQWKEKKLPLTRKKLEVKRGDFTVDSINRDIVIDTDKLAQNLKKYKVIDTRSSKEYSKKSIYGEVRDGHVPGSINIDYLSFRDENGIFLSPEETRKLLSENGITKNDTIVTYCTAGVRAAMAAYVIDSAGYKVMNYDAGFAEWAGMKDLSVEK